MDIPKINFWKITKVSFFSSHKGAKLCLEFMEEVLSAIESLDLPRQEDAIVPEDTVEWKKRNATYECLYDALNDLQSAFNMTDDHCRQNNEMWSTYENLKARYKRLQERYGEHSSWA